MLLKDATRSQFPSTTNFRNGAGDFFNNVAPIAGFAPRGDHLLFQRGRVGSKERIKPSLKMRSGWSGRFPSYNASDFAEWNSSVATVRAGGGEHTSIHPTLYGSGRDPKSARCFTSAYNELIHSLHSMTGIVTFAA
jgi:hypothetical protein